MYPQQQQSRAEMFEYPTEEVSFEGLLQRRRNHQRDYLMKLLNDLAVWKARREEDPKEMISGKGPDGQPKQISITEHCNDQIQSVKEASKVLSFLDGMVERAKNGTVEEMWNAEALTPLTFPFILDAVTEGGEDEGKEVTA